MKSIIMQACKKRSLILCMLKKKQVVPWISNNSHKAVTVLEHAAELLLDASQHSMCSASE
jgi:hypothetical protein